MNIRSVAIVLNAGSGRQNGENAEDELRAAFSDLGVEIRFYLTRKYPSVGAATHAALAETDGPIIAAGGDGTISGVAAAMCQSDRCLGIIPLGTFNYFARSLDIPQEIAGSTAIIAEGIVRNVDIATVNGESFLNNASVGAYPAILQTREGIYRRWGRSRFAAYWSVIKALATFRTALDLEITLNGQLSHVRTPLVFAINNAFQLDQMGLSGQDCIASGKMVLLIAPNTGRWGMMKHAVTLAMGKARRNTDYDMMCGDDILIKMRRKRRLVACDGEISRMAGPLHLRRGVCALNVIVPRTAEEDIR